MRIKLEDKELEVNNYKEKRIKENEEEIPLYSFEFEAYSEEDRREIRKLLSLRPITLSIEGKEPIQVMIRNFSESYTEGVLPYHFVVELIPYKKTYTLQDFTVSPLIKLIKLNEDLIKVLIDKRILKMDEIIEAADKLFADEKTREKIIEFYYGSDVMEFLKSLGKKR